jgi:hypothetical protein
VLVAALSHFLELKSELELIGSGQNTDLTDDQADALWPLVSMASNMLALVVPSLIAHNPPNGVGE